jgi:hypothetical protein
LRPFCYVSRQDSHLPCQSYRCRDLISSPSVWRLCTCSGSVAYWFLSCPGFHTTHCLCSVYTRQRDSVCVKVALLSRVIVPYGSIIPLSSIMAGLLEIYVLVYCLVSLRLEWEILGGTIKNGIALLFYCDVVLRMMTS